MNYLDQNKYDDLFFEADQMIADKNFGGAISNLEAIIAEAPEFGKAYNHLGWIQETKFKDYTKAEELYKLCLKYSPNYTPIYLNLSILLCTLGKFDEQKQLLEKAMLVPGIDKAAMSNELALMFEMQGDYANAITNLKNAVRFSLNDNSIEIYSKSMERCKKKMDLLK